MMTSDINGTVIAIQGNAVQAGTLNSVDDGYVLTWNNANNQWEAKAPVGLKSQTFTSSGTWVCPAGVTNVIIDGFGGGGGGGGGYGNQSLAIAGSGGGGSIRVVKAAVVIPGITYTITIGLGGSGGSGGKTGGSGPNIGNSGGDSIIDSSVPINIYRAGGGGYGYVATNNASHYTMGGLNTADNGNTYTEDANYGFSCRAPGCGGQGAYINQYPGKGLPNEGKVGGNGGQHNTTDGAGGGGGAGPESGGATGGGGTTNGDDAPANSGAGGGGGGSTTTNANGGSGGTGGSGQITIAWIG